MFCHDCSYNMRFIFTNTKAPIEFYKVKNIPNTPSKHLKFSFSVKGLSNLTCLRERVGKSL